MQPEVEAKAVGGGSTTAMAVPGLPPVKVSTKPPPSPTAPGSGPAVHPGQQAPPLKESLYPAILDSLVPRLLHCCFGDAWAARYIVI